MSRPASHHLKRAKRALRREVLARRDALDPRERAKMSEAVVSRVLEIPELAGAAAVMAFWSFGSEVDTAPLLDRLQAEGRVVALPRIEAAGIVPVTYRSGETVRSTSFGAREPADGRALAADELDLVLVPGVAFDRSGGRVGYGGGYYDRLIGRLRTGVPTIGLAFSLQLVPAVPAGGMDRPIEAVVTEREVIRCR